MARIPQSIRVQPVRNGIEIIAVGRSERGTKYFMDSIVVLTLDTDAEVTRQNIASAVAQLLGVPSVT